jgi:integrase
LNEQPDQPDSYPRLVRDEAERPAPSVASYEQRVCEAHERSAAAMERIAGRLLDLPLDEIVVNLAWMKSNALDPRGGTPSNVAMTSHGVAVPAAIGVTFDDAIGQWTTKLLADKKSKDTLARYPKTVRQLAFGCGWTNVRQATPDRVMAWLSESAVEDEWSGKSHNNALSSLVAFFGYCRTAGWIDKNPAEGISRAAEEPGDGVRAFTVPEMAAILDAAPARRVAYQFARETGLRKGNQFHNANAKSVACGMVRLAERELRLPPKFMKNKKAIVIPFTGEMAELLAPMIYSRDAAAPLFPVWMDNRTLFDDMARAKVPRVDEHGERAAWHSWRKGFLSALAEGGVHPKTAQELAGHSSVLLTMKHYTRVSGATKRAAVEKIFGVANPVGTNTYGTLPKDSLTNSEKTLEAHGVDGTMSSTSHGDTLMTQALTNHDDTRACRPDASASREKFVGSAGVASPRTAVDCEPKTPVDGVPPTGYTTPWSPPSAGFPAPEGGSYHGVVPHAHSGVPHAHDARTRLNSGSGGDPGTGLVGGDERDHALEVRGRDASGPQWLVQPADPAGVGHSASGAEEGASRSRQAVLTPGFLILNHGEIAQCGQEPGGNAWYSASVEHSGGQPTAERDGRNAGEVGGSIPSLLASSFLNNGAASRDSLEHSGLGPAGRQGRAYGPASATDAGIQSGGPSLYPTPRPPAPPREQHGTVSGPMAGRSGQSDLAGGLRPQPVARLEDRGTGASGYMAVGADLPHEGAGRDSRGLSDLTPTLRLTLLHRLATDHPYAAAIAALLTVLVLAGLAAKAVIPMTMAEANPRPMAVIGGGESV